MFKDFSLLLVISFEIVNCQKPPRLPNVYLPGQKFSLPPICCNAPEWQDLALSLQILSDMKEPKQEKSAFTSLMNLIKFILIKEELSCPVIQQITRPAGKITNAITTLQNSQIVSKIEAALSRKPSKEVTAVELHDNIDVPNMIPILRPRDKNTRRQSKAKATGQGNATISISTPGPKVPQNLGHLTLVGATLNPVVNLLGSKAPCQCRKCIPALSLSINQFAVPKCNFECQRLPTINLSPVVLGCGPNCNICQKLSSPVSTSCRELVSPVVLAGCQKVSSPAKTALSVIQGETIPLMNCYGNMLRKVTTTILVPYCLSKLGA